MIDQCFINPFNRVSMETVSQFGMTHTNNPKNLRIPESKPYMFPQPGSGGSSDLHVPESKPMFGSTITNMRLGNDFGITKQNGWITVKSLRQDSGSNVSRETYERLQREQEMINQQNAEKNANLIAEISASGILKPSKLEIVDDEDLY